MAETRLDEIGLEILSGFDSERAARPHLPAVMAATFRRHRDLPDGERGTIVERVYNVVRLQRLLDHLLERAGGGSLTGARRLRARWFAARVVAADLTPREAAQSVREVDFARLLEARATIRTISNPIERLAVDQSLPDWIARRWIEIFGETRAIQLARASNATPPQTLRANESRIDRETLSARLHASHALAIRPTRFASSGLVIETPTQLFRLPEFREGLFEMQDEGSQLVSELVAPPPRGWVLDACAGSGGKTLHLAAMLQASRKPPDSHRSRTLGASRGSHADRTVGDTGEAAPERGGWRITAAGVGRAGARQLQELLRRAERAGVAGLRVVELPEEGAFPPALARAIGRVDRVLIDAPCSGLGVLRRNPEARWRLEETDIVRLVELQGSILRRFAPFVKPGGRLVYATCSVLPEENEQVVESFLAEQHDFRIMEAKEILGRDRAMEIGDGRFLRVFPHVQGTDGFFAAVMRKVVDEHP